MNEPTDWVSAIAILSAGIVIGLLFLYFFSRRRTKAMTLGDDSDLARKDLEAKRDALIQQLRDIGENAGPDERARLENETAAVLRQLDQQPVRPASGAATTAVAGAPGPGMNPTVKGFLWGAGSFAALAGLFYFVMQASTPRPEGGSVTGNTPMAQQQAAAPAPDPAVTQLEAAVQKDPENLQLRNDLAQAYLERENLMAVFEQTKFVLDRKPDDSRALTYGALVRMAMGRGGEATEMLQHATQSDPKNLDGWVSLAWVYAQQNDMRKAEAMIASAVRESPENRARLEDVMRQMRQAAMQPAQPGPVSTASGELPPGHPAIDGGPAAAAPAPMASAQGAASVTVTLELDPSATTKNGVLFVLARNPMGGPPAAVKRMQNVVFPVTISLSSADSMMGQPLPSKFRLEARLDSDGDATTKPPTDPAASQNDVVPGATVRLSLQ